MFDLSEIEELFKSEEFMKSKALVRGALPHIKVLNDPKSTPEQKQDAITKLKALDSKGRLPESLQGKSEKFTKLQQLTQDAQKDLHGVANEKLADASKKLDSRVAVNEKEVKEANVEDRAKIKAHERLNGRGAWHTHKVTPEQWEKFSPSVKQHLEETEHPDKKAKREEWNQMNMVLPGSDYTKKELEIQASRAAGETKPKPIKERYQSPTQEVKAAKNKDKSDISGALDVAHKAHAAGLHDKAIAIVDAIPKEHIPSNMKGYNPLYMHYGVTPNHYAATPDGHDDLHNFHNDVVNGKHNDNPHLGIQKVIQHLKPKVIA
jgi:hypothetical protein